MEKCGEDHIVVVGLGYVGLPLAVALARTARVTGLDVNEQRVEELRSGVDRTQEVQSEALSASSLRVTSDAGDCRGASAFIITVPTPVDQANRPDLRPVLAATESVAGMLDAAARPVIIYESTVYPGVTEELCGPLIEKVSGLRRGEHFFLGYSPERINPGDREHSVDRIVKVIAGENAEVTERLADIYGRVTQGGVFRAKSIMVAEAAKVIENAQRDINIAFMNEIAQIFSKLGLSTLDVIETAATKWNFLKFRPGLVGGHCIGVDPYYLSHCAQSLGHLPRVILAGRSINDGMGTWVADCLHSRRNSRAGDVLVLGVTFKEDVPDLRNSKVIDLVNRLQWLGHRVTIRDPMADQAELADEFDAEVGGDPESRYDILIAAVPHRPYREMTSEEIGRLVRDGALVADLHGIWSDRSVPAGLDRWTL